MYPLFLYTCGSKENLLYFRKMIQKFTQSRLNRWILTVLTGVLLTLSFPETGSLSWLSFVAWIPILAVESYFSNQKKSASMFLHAYVSFFIYNVGATWWIYHASAGGAYMAFFANSLLMALTFLVFHRLKKKLSGNWTLALLICAWLSFEFLHYNWELSWPWLNLGNVFAIHPTWVQWYAVTGVLGGTLWILIVNYLFYKTLSKPSLKLKNNYLIAGLAVILIPITFSYITYFSKSISGKPYEVAVIQPNIDPYGEKFVLSNEEQLLSILNQADKVVTKNTKLVVAPETALFPNGYIYEGNIRKEVFFHQINEHRARWRNAGFLIGASTFQLFDKKVSSVAYFQPQFNSFLEQYNSSILFDNTPNPKIIHKSKLVLGVEKIPFVNMFPFLENWAVEMEGGSGSNGVEKEPKVFTKNQVSFAPVVCYESVYGEWVAKQTKLGAHFIAVITNDGWWKDTPGYKQHFHFSRLRAIESNKYVVRSANTGRSGIINNRGDVVKQTAWWQKDAFTATIQLNLDKTLYQQLGDFIGVFAVVGLISFYFMRLFYVLKWKK